MSEMVNSWVVHLNYGIGEIEAVEKRTLNGEKRDYYRVKTRDSTFWVLVESADNERIRPLASMKRIRRALRVLRKAPRKMASNYKERRKWIQENILDGSLRSDMRMLRDLNARKQSKGLNDSELKSYELTKRRFLEEWALCAGIELEEARQKMNKMLKESLNKDSEH